MFFSPPPRPSIYYRFYVFVWLLYPQTRTIVSLIRIKFGFSYTQTRLQLTSRFVR